MSARYRKMFFTFSTPLVINPLIRGFEYYQCESENNQCQYPRQ